MPDDNIDLATLADDELVAQMHDDLYDGLEDEIAEGTNILLDRGWGPDKVLNEALVEGMRIVGIDFRDGILFVPEVLLAANAMKAGMAILRPLLAETGARADRQDGDRHRQGRHPRHRQEPRRDDAGGRRLRGASTSASTTDADKYLAALDEHKPDILGMSALLTTTMPYMKVVIETLKEKGIRDDYIVLVGGAPLNEEFGKAVGADAYCRDAAVAAETAKALVLARRAASYGAPDDRARASSRAPARSLVLACGALARELRARPPARDGCAARRPSRTCRPTSTTAPSAIAPAVRRAVRRRSRGGYGRVFVAYADCGTGGALDALLERARRRPAAGRALLRGLRRRDGVRGAARRGAGTFYLTDFLARHFDALVIRGLGLDRHPELRDSTSATTGASSTSRRPTTRTCARRARAAADRLGLAYEQRGPDTATSLPSLHAVRRGGARCLSSPSSGGGTSRRR